MRLLTRSIAPSLLFFACALLCRAQPAATTQPRQDAQPSPLTLGEWKEFAPAGGGFSILFPGTPATITNTKRIDDRASVEIRSHILNRPPLECGVVYADYPVRVGDPAAARALLDSAAKGAPGNGGQLLSFTEIEHEGHPARMFRARRPSGRLLRGKSVLVGARKYEIICMTPSEDGASAETLRQYDGVIAKFIDSFKLAAAKATSADGPSGPIGPPPGVPDDAVAVALDATQPGEVDQYLADHPRQVYGMPVEGGSDLVAPADQSRVRKGAVVVWVVVDEEGRVVAAQVVSGHPLLRPPTLKAAREARFEPTLLDGKPIKVLGTITYNFHLR